MKRWMILIGVLAVTSARGEIRTLTDLVRIARENNPTILNAREKIYELEARKRQAWAPVLPSVSWILSGASRKEAVLGGIARFGGKPYNQYSSNLQFTQNLFSKGAFDALESLENEVSIQQQVIALEERDLLQRLIENFYRVILNRDNYETLLQNQQIIDQAMKNTQASMIMGRGQKLDLLQVKTQAALLVPQIQQAKNSYETATQELLTLMGDPGQKVEREFKLRGKLKLLLLNQLEKQLAASKRIRPEIDINSMRLEQLENQRQAILGTEYPTLRLTGSYFYLNNKKEELFEDYARGRSIMLELTVPIFNGFTYLHQSRSLASMRTQMLLDRRAIDNEIKTQETNGLNSVMTSQSSVVAAQEAVKLSENARLEAQRIYKLSQIDFLQFLSVQQAALQAQLSFNNLKYQNLLAHLNYCVAAGYSLDAFAGILSKEGANDKK